MEGLCGMTPCRMLRSASVLSVARVHEAAVLVNTNDATTGDVAKVSTHRIAPALRAVGEKENTSDIVYLAAAAPCRAWARYTRFVRKGPPVKSTGNCECPLRRFDNSFLPGNPLDRESIQRFTENLQ